MTSFFCGQLRKSYVARNSDAKHFSNIVMLSADWKFDILSHQTKDNSMCQQIIPVPLSKNWA